MNAWIRSILMPVQGTAYAGRVDHLYLFLIYVSAFFFLLVAGLTGYFVIRYRRRGPGDRTPNIRHHHGLEIAWTLIPLAIVIYIFFWGFHSYADLTVSPADALEIQVTAKKWLWQFEYPNGVRTINELHVPLGKPVKLVMTSEDVIHGFFVPTFRIKQDVVPNTYTQLWFQATVPGMHQLECTQYCGQGHSTMLAKIFVDDEKKYADWLATGGDLGKNMPLAQFGALLYDSRGCKTCHSLDGVRGQGPSFKGIWGHPVKLSDGKSVMVDENYVRESILFPQAKIVAGFEPIMPTFQGLLREREIQALMEFVKAQK
ncbi:MAG TPA: cytochrome c oxidase subunit II [Bryobacteraceae bacterium]|nr:cytochrome c oxidase subunit II [Bryobacteraceae bacterium]